MNDLKKNVGKGNIKCFPFKKKYNVFSQALLSPNSKKRNVDIFLGFNFRINTTSAKTYYVDGLGEGVVWLRDLECVGSENNLMECSYDGWGITSGCNGHRKDVGIICINESDPNHFAQQG